MAQASADATTRNDPRTTRGTVPAARMAQAGHQRGRLPIVAKILLANSSIVALGAMAGTSITIWHVVSFPESFHYELIAVFAAAGLLISFVVNYLVLKATLAPLDRLQQAVAAVRCGDLSVRVSTAEIADERLSRLVSTFNEMLCRLDQDARRLHQLSGAMLQAQEEERRRVARELHDEAGQALTMLLVRLRLLERSETPEDARRQVQELRRLTAAALDEIRRVALELRPTILDDLGLDAALGWRVDELNGAGAVAATLEIGQPGERLPREIRARALPRGPGGADQRCPARSRAPHLCQPAA